MKEPQQDIAPMDALLDEAVTVAAGLQALNETIEQQRQSIADLCEHLMQSTIDLAAAALAVRAGDKQLKSASDDTVVAAGQAVRQKVKAAADAATLEESKVPAVTMAPDAPSGPEVRAALVRAYENTLSAQVQLNTVADAALTQGIAILYAEVAGALGQGDTRRRQKKSVAVGLNSTS